MMTLHKILVPVDFSPCSEAALHHAAALAERFDAHIDVLHVWEAPKVVTMELVIPHPDSEHVLAELAHKHAEQAMQQFLRGFEKEPVLAKGRLETGDPCETILRIASAEGYDCIVMGTHGRHGLLHLLMGSVAEKVVRRSPCPVLTIRLPDVRPAEHDAARTSSDARP